MTCFFTFLPGYCSLLLVMIVGVTNASGKTSSTMRFIFLLTNGFHQFYLPTMRDDVSVKLNVLRCRVDILGTKVMRDLGVLFFQINFCATNVTVS